MTAGIGGWDFGLPITQIVVPTGASQTPGSGTTVIGGNLPAELVAAGYTSGLVWYSDSSSWPAISIKYWFIAYGRAGTGENLNFGHVDGTGTITVDYSQFAVTTSINIMRGLFVRKPPDPIATFDVPFNVIVDKWGNDTGPQLYMHYEHALDTLYASLSRADVASGVVANWVNTKTSSFLTDSSGKVDTWITANTAGLLPAGTYVVRYNVSYDRMVTINYDYTLTSGTLPANIQGLPTPAGIPAYSGLNGGAGGILVGQGMVRVGPGNFAYAAAYLDPTSGMLTFQPSVGTAARVIATVTYPTAKV